jgi:hypothetical protein
MNNVVVGEGRVLQARIHQGGQGQGRRIFRHRYTAPKRNWLSSQ